MQNITTLQKAQLTPGKTDHAALFGRGKKRSPKAGCCKLHTRFVNAAIDRYNQR